MCWWYILRHYTSWNSEALRNWKFEGSNDAKNWECIKEHINIMIHHMEY